MGAKKSSAENTDTVSRQVTGQTVELPEASFTPSRDHGTYDDSREADEFRGNENNRRVEFRRAMKGDTGVKADPKAAARAEGNKAVDTVVLGDGSAGPSPNAPATLTENPAGTLADPEGLTARAGNGGGAPGSGLSGWSSNV